MTGCLRGAGQVRAERRGRLLLVRHGAEAVPGQDPGLGQEGARGGEEGRLLDDFYDNSVLTGSVILYYALGVRGGRQTSRRLC